MVLGKGVAAGYPLSVVLGQRGYLNTYDKKYLLQLNKTVGTFAAWHGGIVASNVLLESIIAEDENRTSILQVGVRQQLKTMITKLDQFTLNINLQLANEGLPLRLRSFSNTFTIDYLAKSEFVGVLVMAHGLSQIPVLAHANRLDHTKKFTYDFLSYIGTSLFGLLQVSTTADTRSTFLQRDCS